MNQITNTINKEIHCLFRPNSIPVVLCCEHQLKVSVFNNLGRIIITSLSLELSVLVGNQITESHDVFKLINMYKSFQNQIKSVFLLHYVTNPKFKKASHSFKNGARRMKVTSVFSKSA